MSREKCPNLNCRFKTADCLFKITTFAAEGKQQTWPTCVPMNHSLSCQCLAVQWWICQMIDCRFKTVNLKSISCSSSHETLLVVKMFSCQMLKDCMVYMYRFSRFLESKRLAYIIKLYCVKHCGRTFAKAQHCRIYFRRYVYWPPIAMGYFVTGRPLFRAEFKTSPVRPVQCLL